MDNINIVKKTTLTVEERPLTLVLLYLRSISLQTRNNLKKSLKTYLIAVKYNFHFKDRISQRSSFWYWL